MTQQILLIFFFFIAVYSSTTWLGLRFFRALILLKVTDVLVFVRIVESSSAIKLGNLCSKGAVMVYYDMTMFDSILLEWLFDFIHTYTRQYINVFAFWFQVLFSAGMIHLLENTGDPWKHYCNHMESHMGFTDCVYFLLITMSTVNMLEIRKIKILIKI